jgi:hypothetical protein
VTGDRAAAYDLLQLVATDSCPTIPQRRGR